VGFAVFEMRLSAGGFFFRAGSLPPEQVLILLHNLLFNCCLIVVYLATLIFHAGLLWIFISDMEKIWKKYEFRPKAPGLPSPMMSSAER
jgi:hypothetical protein